VGRVPGVAAFWQRRRAAHLSKLRLHTVIPKRGERLFYCDHIDGDGEGLFRLAREHELEGIVAKRKSLSMLKEADAAFEANPTDNERAMTVEGSL
jgi:ATP-dependent DNA ligase